jgi:homoserine O-acetyltransferase
LIESYLDHQGEKFCHTYDPNSLLYISKAMDMFDMSYPLPHLERKCNEQLPGESIYSTQKELVKGLLPIQMPALILGVQTDLLFPIWQQKEIADCLKNAGNSRVTYYEIDAKYGHDTFLMDTVNVGSAVKGHLEMH